MKKTNAIFLLLPLIIWCCDIQPAKEKQTVFYTQDSMYKVSFNKPTELDTFYSWLAGNCTQCDTEHRYRFSKSKFPLAEETGFFSSPIADSTYRITFSHLEKYRCKSSIDSNLSQKHDWYLPGAWRMAKSQGYRIDTLYSRQLRINGRPFIMYAYKQEAGQSNKYWTHYLKARTNIDGNLLVFECECRSKNCEGFIERMEKSLNTIKIEYGKLR